MSIQAIDLIYVRGGDKFAPNLAKAAGWKYGVRYDYKAYAPVFMLDVGLSPRWATYTRKVRSLQPNFALTPDYEQSDPVLLNLYIDDLRPYVERIGVCPKFVGAVSHIPDDCVICESIPTTYAGFLIPDDELLPQRDYHLLGGDPRQQLAEIRRIHNAGGRVVSLDGNKLMMKAAHGQVFDAKRGQWRKANGTTSQLANISAHEISLYLKGGFFEHPQRI